MVLSENGSCGRKRLRRGSPDARSAPRSTADQAYDQAVTADDAEARSGRGRGQVGH
jgi:hypothetical protein